MGGATFRSYSADEYRKAGVDAGPFALEGNPDPEKRNYRTTRRKPILGVVMHITAGMTDYVGADTSAEATTRYGADTTRDASWHVCIDSDGIIPSIRDSYVAWHAGVADIPNVNDATLGIEQGTGTTNWAGMPDWWVEKTLRNVAVWLAPRVKAYGIPLVVLRDRDELDRAIRAGRKFGFVSHATVAPSNRRDPGMVGNPPTWVDTYPWARLFDLIRAELSGTPTSPEEDDMQLTDRIQLIDGNGVDFSTETSTVEGVMASTLNAAHASLAKLTALTAAVNTLAAAQGMDPAVVERILTAAVDKALGDLRITREG